MLLFTPAAPVGETRTDARGTGTAPFLAFERVSLAFDEQVVLRDLTFTVPRGAMIILLGASGSGKSVVLKLVLGLLRPDSGAIRVGGRRVDRMSETELMTVRADIGMLFQEGALFDSLTVGENVGYRLLEECRWPTPQVEARVAEVLATVGLAGYADRMPAHLSGGERRRVAIARAMAARPGLVLLDEPTSGLDPITATSVDNEIVKLRDLERVTAIVATHQIRDAFYVATHRAVREDDRVRITPSGDDTGVRFLLLHDGGVRFEGTASELTASRDPLVRKFLFATLPPW